MRSFLENGGWWVVLAPVVLLILLLLGLLLRGTGRLLFGGRRRPGPDPESPWRINLDDCPLPPRPPGDRRLYVYHLPVRVRLVVLAFAGTDVEVEPAAVGAFLDHVVPDMRDQADWDCPRVQVWPRQLSREGFANAFHRRTLRKGADGTPSRWILLAGKVQLGPQTLLVGLGLWTDEPSTIGRLTLEQHQWLDVVRIRRED